MKKERDIELLKINIIIDYSTKKVSLNIWKTEEFEKIAEEKELRNLIFPTLQTQLETLLSWMKDHEQ